jgi:hypothetical protein
MVARCIEATEAAFFDIGYTNVETLAVPRPAVRPFPLPCRSRHVSVEIKREKFSHRGPSWSTALRLPPVLHCNQLLYPELTDSASRAFLRTPP